MWDVGKKTKIPWSCNASPISASYTSRWLPWPVDLVPGNWSRAAQFIRHHLPGCMLLTSACVSITQMPQILSLQDWIEDWAAWKSKEGSLSFPSAPAGAPGPASSTSLTACGSLEQIWRFMFIRVLMPAGLLNQRWSYKPKKFTARL